MQYLKLLNPPNIKFYLPLVILVFTGLVCFGQNSASGQSFIYTVKKYTSSNSELVHNRVNGLHFDEENALYAMTSHGYSKFINWDTPYPDIESVNNLNIGRYNSLIRKDEFCSFDRENNFYYHLKDSSSLFFSWEKENILSAFEMWRSGPVLLDSKDKLFFVKEKNDYDSIQLSKNVTDPYSYLFAIDLNKKIYITSKHTDSLVEDSDRYIYKFSPSGLFEDSLAASVKNMVLVQQKTESPHFILNKSEITHHPDLENFLADNFSVGERDLDKSFYYNRFDKLFWTVQDSYLLGLHYKNGIVHKIPVSDSKVVGYNITFFNRFIFIPTNNGLIQVEIQKNKFSTIQDTSFYGMRRIKKKSDLSYHVGSDGGLHVLDSNLQPISQFEQNGVLFPSSFTDSKDNIWVNYRGTVLTYDQSYQLINSIKIAERISRSEPLAFHWGFLESKKGIIWTVAGNKLLAFQNREKFRELDLSLSSPGDVFEIFEQDSAYLWICTSNGLLKTNRFTGETERFSNQEEGENYLPCKDIHDLFIDKNGVFWIASGDAGLIRWSYQKTQNDKQNNEAFGSKVFNTQSGMPSNILTGIEADDFGFLWIGTERGLVRFHKESHNIQVFTQDEGTTDNEFNRLSHHRDEEGIIYFGGLTGITYFNPKDFLFKESEGKLSIKKVLTRFQSIREDRTDIFEKEQVIRLAEKGAGLELIYGNQSPQSKVFYSLNNGISWWETTENRIILNSLPAGSFLLNVKEEAIDGSLISELIIPVETPVPFYLKSWFYLSLFLAVILAGIGLYQWRTVLLRRRKEELEKIIEERTRTIVEQGEILQQQSHAQNRFFRNIAHELKTPLTLINGSTNLMEQISKPALKESQKKLLKTIKQNSDIILNLSDEILLLSQLQSKQINELDYAPVSGFLFFRKLFDTFSTAAVHQEKEYEFKHNLAPETAVLLDTSKIEKIVLNLISNAFKYTKKGDRITFNVRQNLETKSLQIEVTDTGKGIKTVDLPHIFDPFFRSNAVGENFELEEITGVGVGLAIVKELVEIYKGTINVKSKPDEGSTFELSIPYELSPAILTSPDDKMPDSKTYFPEMSRQNHHLLIIEDSKELRVFLRQFLEQYFQVSIVKDTKEAFAILSKSVKTQQEATVSLIITDLLLPSQYGLDFIEEIKKNIKWRTIPVIITSSDYTKTNKRKAKALGLKYFLPKPYSLEKLLTCIHESLESNSSASELSTSTEHIEFDNIPIRINEVIQAKLHDSDLSVELLADELSVSKRHLTRIIKQKTGLSPIKYINELRLRKARELLRDDSYSTISEVVYAVGFKSPNYFTKLFKLRFGRLPSSFKD